MNQTKTKYIKFDMSVNPVHVGWYQTIMSDTNEKFGEFYNHWNGHFWSPSVKKQDIVRGSANEVVNIRTFCFVNGGTWRGIYKNN